MIQQPTVLVLGAGASAPYGFPAGAELRRLIISSLRNSSITGAGVSPLVRLLENAGFTSARIETFRNELMHADTMSVDLFLERRPNFMDIGKVAIAATLLPFEADSLKTMFEPWSCNETAQERAAEGWYQYFTSQLRLGFSDWGRGLLSILTYNYDRSLEHYLFTILRSSCNEIPKECWKKFKEIPIIHLHGELGPYNPLSEEDGLPYGISLDADSAKRAADEIKIIDEVEPGGRFAIAQKALSDAETVCFLGFRYAPENMARLDWTHRNDTGRWKRLFGTVYKLTPAEQRRLKLGQYFNVTPGIPNSFSILHFLKETDVLG
jgi:hypothetical protein